MENDNIKKNENLQEEPVADTALPEETENTLEEISNAAEETAVETEDVGDLIGDEWQTDGAVEEPEVVEAPQVVELSEEDIAKMEALKKKKRKRNIIIVAAVAVVVAIVAFFVCYIEGVGSKNVVSKAEVTDTAEESGFWSKLKTDNIRYENPIVTAFDKITGKNKDAVMKINGHAVDKDVLNFVTNSSAVNCVYSLIQTGAVTDISSFDWKKVDEEVGMSYLELSKAMAVETLIPIYATIAEGEKRGVEFTDEDDKNIKDWIAEQKKNYGEDFEKTLKDSGYADEDTLYEIQKIQLYMQKVYEDIEDNPSKYITNSIKKKIGDDKITVKHILIGFDMEEDGTVTDEAKAKAKKTAEEVLAKVKAGEDFDKLVDEYNTDPGASDEGYTFAQDGSMVEEFEDASFALEIGQTSEIVETAYGYHIIKRIERNITADDFISVIQETAPVNIKKGVFDKMKVTIDLNTFFGTPEEAEESAENQED